MTVSESESYSVLQNANDKLLADDFNLSKLTMTHEMILELIELREIEHHSLLAIQASSNDRVTYGNIAKATEFITETTTHHHDDRLLMTSDNDDNINDHQVFEHLTEIQ